MLIQAELEARVAELKAQEEALNVEALPIQAAYQRIDAKRYPIVRERQLWERTLIDLEHLAQQQRLDS